MEAKKVNVLNEYMETEFIVDDLVKLPGQEVWKNEPDLNKKLEKFTIWVLENKESDVRIFSDDIPLLFMSMLFRDNTLYDIIDSIFETWKK